MAGSAIFCTMPSTTPRAQKRLRDRLLAILASVIDSRPRLILALALILSAVGGIFSISMLQLDADTNSLIGEDRPFMRTYRAYLDRYGDLEAIYVVVDAGDPIDTESARMMVDRLTEELKRIPELRSVRSTITPEEQWRLAAHAMPQSRLDELILTTPALEALLGDQDVESLLAAASQALVETMAPTGADQQERIDSFANACLILNALTEAEGSDGLATRLRTRYLTSATGRMYFIEIMPKKDFSSFAVIDGPLKSIRKCIKATSKESPGLRIGVTGKPVLQADELATSARDMTQGTILALLAIAIMFMFYFREWKRPLLAVLAFLIAFGWTYGAATLIVGRLNLLSMVFMLVLVGAGIDYGVHVLARWRESRESRTASKSLGHIMKTAVTGNLTGAVTSAGVFFLALSTSFQGLRELGIIAGLGLLFCALSMGVVLPALLKLTEHDDRQQHFETARKKTNPLRGCSLTRDRTVMVLALTTLVPVGVVAFQSLRFESNLLALQSPDLDSVVWENALFEDDSSGSWFGAIIVETLEDIPDVIERARSHEEVGPIRSALDFIALPDSKRDDALETLSQLHESADPTSTPGSGDDPGAVKDALQRAAEALNSMLALGGNSIDSADRIMLETLRLQVGNFVKTSDTMMMADLERAREDARRHVDWLTGGADQPIRAVLPEAVRARFSAEDGSYAVLIQPAENIWSPDAMTEFVRVLRAISPDVTGVPITQHESIREMHHAFLVMSWGAIFVVGIALWLDFRSGPKTLACLLTLSLAMAWTLGAMAMLGLSINLANFFAIPILIGLGADSAIHVLHRWELVRMGEEEDFGETLKAITLTACTTGLGFGTLVLAHHQGLQSLGWVMLLGSASTLIASTVVLPAGLRVMSRSKWKKRLANID